MEITITIPDNKKDEIIDAFAAQYKYQSEIDGDANPTSKREFTLSIIKSFIKDVYVASKVGEFTKQRSNVSEAAKAEIEEIMAP